MSGHEPTAASGYSPLKFDVRHVVVPDEWRGCEFEYRHGFGKGLERDGVYNPVSHRATHAARELFLPNPRLAWYAGYQAGCAKREQAAAEA